MKVFSKEKKGLQQFVDKISEDSALRERLQKAADGYEGDKTNMEAMVDSTIIPIAEKEGYVFSASDYIIYLKKEVERRLANTAVSDDELFAVSGGVGDVEINGDTTGDVTIIDQHEEYHQYNYNINIILTPDTSPDTMRALGQMFRGN